MLRSLRIRYEESLKFRLSLQLLVMGSAVTILVSSLILYLAKESVTKTVKNQIQAVRDGKIRELQGLLGSMEQDLTSLAYSRPVQDSFFAFDKAQRNAKQNKDGEPEKKESDLFKEVSSSILESLEESRARFKVQNVHIVSNAGTVLFQTNPDSLLGKNLTGPDFVSTHYSKCIAGALNSKTNQFSDLMFSSHLNRSVAYLCAPVLARSDKEGIRRNTILGVLSVEIDWSRIEAITSFRSGLGETGEVFLVGSDQSIRTSSAQPAIWTNRSDNQGQHKGVFAGRSASGEDVISAYAHLEFKDVSWLVVADVKAKEVYKSLAQIDQISVLIIIACALIMALFGYFIGRNIGHPVIRVAKIARLISEGHLDINTVIDSKDEVGQLMQAMQTMVEVITSLVDDLSKLTQDVVDGKLSSRLDATKYQGDFATLADSINSLLVEVLKPSAEAESVLRQLARGDLRTQMVGEYRGDNAQIKTSVNTMIESLKTLVLQIHEACLQMRDKVAQVGVSSGELSSGVTEQAAAVEQIATTMYSIGNQSSQNSESSVHAKSVADVVSQNAVVGNHQMDQLLVAIREISVSSGNISRIIKVIDEIAFQTNLLALNAAVEAARAGRHGKGFAVVAEEVRSLAARSAKAAKETAELIDDSRQKVEKGMNLAQGTAHGLIEIVDGINKVKEAMREIARASKDQAEGVNQVTRSLQQVTLVTHKNSKSSSHTAAAAESLEEQTENLLKMLEQFKTGPSEQQVVSSTEKVATSLSPEEHLSMASGFGVKTDGSNVMSFKKAKATSVSRVKVDDSDFGDS